jgi:hypothetical protein
MILHIESLNIDAFREIYDEHLDNHLVDIKKGFKNKLVTSIVFFTLSIISFALIPLSFDWFHFGAIFLIICIGYTFSGYRNRKKSLDTNNNDRQKVEKALNDFAKVKKWTLDIGDRIIVTADNAHHEFKYSEFTQYIINDNYIFLFHVNSSDNNIMIPRKTVSNEEYSEIVRIFKDNLESNAL